MTGSGSGDLRVLSELVAEHIRLRAERDALRTALGEALMLVRLIDPARELTANYRSLADLLPTDGGSE